MTTEGTDNIYFELECAMDTRSDTTSLQDTSTTSSRLGTNTIVHISSGTNNQLFPFQPQCPSLIDEWVHEGSSREYDKLYADKMSSYTVCTIKQLHVICEYYDILRSIQHNRLKKDDIIEQIIWFETQTENTEIVARRELYWSYLEKIKSDKTLARFVATWKFNTL